MKKKSLCQWFLIFFIPPVLIAGILLFFMNARELENEKRLFELDEQRQLEGDARTIRRTFSGLASDMRSLASEEGLSALLAQNTHEQRWFVSEQFSNFLVLNLRYDQIQLIDREGLERLRVSLHHGEVDLSEAEVDAEALELEETNFSGPLEIESARLKAGRISFSPFRLTPEGGRGQGLDPVIEITARLLDREGRHQGLIRLRYRFLELLHQINRSEGDQSDLHMLINAEGRQILESKQKGRASHLLEVRSFKDSHPAAWKKIKAQASGYFYGETGLYSFVTINPGITAVDPGLASLKAGSAGIGSGKGEAGETRGKVSRGKDAQLKVVSLVPKRILKRRSMGLLKILFLLYVFYALVMAFGAGIIALMMVKREKAETSLQEREECMGNIVKTASDGIITIDGEGHIETINPAAEKMFGYAAAELLGKKLEILMPASYRKPHHGYLMQGQKKDRLGENGAIGLGRTLQGLRKNGSVFPIEITLSKLKKGDRYTFTGIIRDISERVKFEEELRHNAFYDSLTKLPNRMLFRDRIADCLKQSGRKEGLFAVLFLDLDRFKMINDSLGHLAGDQLLVALAKRLSSCVRACDTVSRLGGDEMGILLEDIVDLGDVTIVADRILKAIKKSFRIDEHQFVCTTSIGIALSASGYKSPDDILRDADIAMYRAKVGGRARYEIFDDSMRAKILDQQILERDLRLAVEQEAFTVHYQPVVLLETERIVHFEALLRWQHPERGMISPATFIPLAEECGEIIPLGRFVLREACRQMRRWQADYPDEAPLGMSVNVSEKQLIQGGFVEEVRQVIGETGIDPTLLNIEITESLLMENVDLTNKTLLQLKSLGIQLHIDDFGTGYSSLSYLHKFPFDVLKIDYSFTSEMCSDESKLKIVTTILSLAKELGLSVITEGIETRQQLTLLKELSCAYGQGYYFSRPLPAEAAGQLIAEQVEADREVEAV